jgi:hypothetical protein
MESEGVELEGLVEGGSEERWRGRSRGEGEEQRGKSGERGGKKEVGRGRGEVM